MTTTPAPGPDDRPCAECRGTGLVKILALNYGDLDTEACPDCNGTGKIAAHQSPAAGADVAGEFARKAVNSLVDWCRASGGSVSPQGYRLVETIVAALTARLTAVEGERSRLKSRDEGSLALFQLHDCDWGCGCGRCHCAAGQPCLRCRVNKLTESESQLTRSLATVVVERDAARRDGEALREACKACVEQLSPANVDVVIKPGRIPYAITLAKAALAGPKS